MNGRTFVLIFFFWFIITIVTPTLVIWTESSKPDLGQNSSYGEMNDRSVIEQEEKQVRNAPEALSDHQELEAEAPTPTPAPAPAPELKPVSRNRKLILRKIMRDSNETVS